MVHLNLHTEYSLLSGAGKISDYINTAKQQGMKAVAITDTCNMFGVIEFYRKCLEAGIKPVIGCQLYIGSGILYPLTLLCENNTGYKNLLKLVSAACTQKTALNEKPSVTARQLKQYHEGLICLSGGISGQISQLVYNSNYMQAKSLAAEYKEIFGENNYFIEVQKFSEADGRAEKLLKFAGETNTKVCATNDVHYLTERDAQTREILLNIANSFKPNSPVPDNQHFFKSEREMLEIFSDCPECVEITDRIAERCNVDIKLEGNSFLPKFDCPVSDHFEYLKKLSYDGLCRRYGKPTEQAEKRLEYELSVIGKMGFTDYFLIVADFVGYARNQDIPVGVGRGSGAGSLAAYCLEITDIDPLEYNLLFERFLNPDRVTMPDFDIDFCIKGRQKVIDYVINKYGSDKASLICTFVTLGAKQSIKYTAKQQGLPLEFAEKTAAAVNSALSIAENISDNDKFKDIYFSDDKAKQLIDDSKKIEGFPRNISLHAAGVVIAPTPLTDYVPLILNNGQISTQYTMKDLEKLGLLKIDFLGLKNLTLIHECELEVRKKIPDFDISKVSIDDMPTFISLQQGQTEGVFQFESEGITNLLVNICPKSIDDMMLALALYRPGPMKSISTFLKNKRNPENIKYKIPQLEPILRETYGCIVYQEQVMQICRELAGFSYMRADGVRYAMSKKQSFKLESERHAFVYGDPDGKDPCRGCTENGIDEKLANELFDEMYSFSKYAYNKSHAVSYAYTAYRTAYLKTHFYNEYICVLMNNSCGEDMNRFYEYAGDCRKRGVKILPPDINKSGEKFCCERDGFNKDCIRFSLLGVKGVGELFAKTVISEREKGNFKNLFDFCKRMAKYERREFLNPRIIEGMIKSGLFDGLEDGLNRRQMLEIYREIINSVMFRRNGNIEGQIDMFGTVFSAPESTQPHIEPMEEFPAETLLEFEKETLGIYISAHPLDNLFCICNALDCKNISEIALKNGEIKICGKITQVRPYEDRSGRTMAFVTIEDKTGKCEAIAFSDCFEKYARFLRKGEFVLLLGGMSARAGQQPKFIVKAAVSAQGLQNGIKSKSLAVQIDETDKNQLEEVRSMFRKFSNPNGKGNCYVFFKNRRKLMQMNNTKITLTAEIIQKFAEIFGAENVKFI